MAEIVNLRQAKKARARAAARVEADAKAARFGRSKAEKAREAAEAARVKAELDGKKRETGETE